MQQSVKHCLQQLTFGNINWRYAIFGGKFVEKFRVGNRSQFALADIERRHHGEFSNGRRDTVGSEKHNTLKCSYQ